MNSLRLNRSDFVISVVSFLTALEPHQYLLLFLFLQPFLGFTRNEDLDLLKHLFYRMFSLSVLLYTLFYISYQKGKIVFPKTGLEIYLLFYAASITLSTLIAIVSGDALIVKSLTSLATVPILISLLYTINYWIDDLNKMKMAVRYLILSVVVVCIIGLIEFVVLGLSGTVGNIRIRSVFIDPNIFARYVLLGIFIVTPFIYFKDNTLFSRKTLIGIVCLFLLNLLLSLSRSGYLTLIAGGIVFSLFLENKKIKSLIISGSIIVGLVIFTYLFAQRSFSGSAIIEQSNINRVQLILGGIDMIQSHWIFGIGYTNFANYFEKHYLENFLSVSVESYKYAGYTTEIHNWVIEVWAEQGIIGLTIFILFFYKIVTLMNNARKQATDDTTKHMIIGFIMIFFTFLFHGFFYHTFISQFIFWTVCGFAIAMNNVTISGEKRYNA